MQSALNAEALLLSAVTRQQQMLRSALSACDSLHSAMQQAAATEQQQQSSMQELEQQLEWAQQQNEQLTVRASTAAIALFASSVSSCSMAWEHLCCAEHA
jgi:hypothetical protein